MKQNSWINRVATSLDGTAKRTAAVLVAIALVLSAAILVNELSNAQRLREAQAENDAKLYAGSTIQDGDIGGNEAGDSEADESEGLAPESSKIELHVPWGWGDSGGLDGLRPSYTLDEVNAGALGERVVFNSISDSVIGDEKNFVGARENDGTNRGHENIWQGNVIEVEDGKEYIIRLYVHNNNPNGEKAVSTGTQVVFSLPQGSSDQIPVNGYIHSGNSAYELYWDSVVFVAEQQFRLHYVKGSALLENNGIGAGGSGYPLSDDIILETGSGHGVVLGFDELDGRLPGGYEYAAYVTIRVRAVFE